MLESARVGSDDVLKETAGQLRTPRTHAMSQDFGVWGIETSERSLDYKSLVLLNGVNHIVRRKNQYFREFSCAKCVQ